MKKLGQESAFPTDRPHDGIIWDTEKPGMSKRFYAACAAMQGLLTNAYLFNALSDSKDLTDNDKIRIIVGSAYSFADELLTREINDTNLP